MKHFEIKNTLAGAGGGGSDPKPPTLNPPEVGDFSVAASYSFSEVIDLISDGPIEGLTNSNGLVLDDSSYLQGLYLNDVPVEVTNNDFTNANKELISSITGTQECFTGTISKAFQAIKDSPNKLYDFISFGGVEDDGPKSYDSEVSKFATALKPQAGKYLVSVVHDRTPQTESPADTLRDSVCIDISDYNTVDGLTGIVAFYDEGTTGTIAAARQKYVDDNKNFYYNIKVSDLEEYGMVAGGTAFFEKQCTGVGGVDTFYMETCLQLSAISGSLNSPVTGIYRNKIDDGVQQLIDISNGTIGNFYTKDYLRRRLLDLGLFLDIDEEGNYESLTKEKIQTFLDTKLTVQTRISTDFENWIFPYIFFSHNTGEVIDGYSQPQHEDLFNNEGSLIQLYDATTTYSAGERFYYDQNGVTYEVNVGSTWDQGPTYTPDNPNPAITPNPLKVILNKENQVSTDLVFDVASCENPLQNSKETLVDLMIPDLDISGNWNGKVFGFVIKNYNVDTVSTTAKAVGNDAIGDVEYINILFDKNQINYYLCATGLGLFSSTSSVESTARKFNYSNVLMEFRRGDPYQNPLGYFKNIYIDHFYNSRLIGPFSTFGLQGVDVETNEGFGVQRLYLDDNGSDAKSAKIVLLDDDGNARLNFAKNRVPEMDEDFLLAYEESSADNRKSGTDPINYATWNSSKVDYDEKAQPVTHIIQNPNVNSCFVTLSLKILADTAENDLAKEGDLVRKIDIGSRYPGVMNIRIAVGLIDEEGNKEQYYDRFFQIIALVESPNYLDIGNPDNVDSAADYKDIRELEPDGDIFDEAENAGGIFEPFELPNVAPQGTSPTDTSTKEDQKRRRYIEVTKLSVETNSTLIKRNVDLVKVTEIIDSQCFYPYSAIVGSKIDSRVFSDVPKRTFRAKLKKVKIPSNYYPTYDNGKDKRYFNKKSELDLIPTQDRYIYKGDWDGTFKFGWTDNPAWVLYDMLTAKRYGLGEQITEDQVNKWDLYKIARFCDAVNEEGYFEGVPDDRGGIEPRFSCNIMFLEGTKIFDAINSIAAIFRGVVFFQNSTIDFLDDRLKDPVALFTNSNVKDGFFSYSNYKRDERFNAVEVNYKDRNDDFKTKIEYIENEEDIIERGLFKKEIIASGITSKAMARRAAKHVMYQTTKENETVAFTAGTEVLLCKPGDLILIEDDLKTLRSNYGRVLDIDQNNKTVRTSNVFNGSDYEKSITLYIPTGNQTKQDLDAIADTVRLRVTGFSLYGTTVYPSFNNNFSGTYKFDRYEKGFDNATSGLYEEYAVYTGDNASEPIIWFGTGHTGWVFSTGQAFTDDNTYNLFTTYGSGFSFINLTNPLTSAQISGASGVDYNSALGDKRDTIRFTFDGEFVYEDAYDLDYFGGVQENRIELNSEPQIRTLNVTGWGGLSGSQKEEYGDLIYVDENDINANLLQFVPEGTVYRFQAKDATDQVYKIISITEEESHSYSVTATKYHSGKYEEIEKDVNVEDGEFTYGYKDGNFFVNDINYITLNSPEVDLVTGRDPSATGTDKEFYISGSWNSIANSTGYNIYVEDPVFVINGPFSTTETNFVYYTPIYIGDYTMNVKAVADRFNNSSINKRFYDSRYDSETVYVSDTVQDVVYEAPFAGGIT